LIIYKRYYAVGVVLGIVVIIGVVSLLLLLGRALYNINNITIRSITTNRENINICPFSIIYLDCLSFSFWTGNKNIGSLLIVYFTVNNHLYAGKIPTSATNSCVLHGAIDVVFITNSF
jgi:O-antigen ligase